MDVQDLPAKWIDINNKYSPKDPPDKIHILLGHSLDVAAVAHVIWNYYLHSTVIRIITVEFSLTEREAMRTLLYLVALHDIGKAHELYLCKNKYIWEHLCCIDQTLPEIDNISGYPDHLIPHGWISSAYIYRKFSNMELATVIDGHRYNHISNIRSVDTPECWMKLMDKINEILVNIFHPVLNAIINFHPPVLNVTKNQKSRQCRSFIFRICKVADHLASEHFKPPYSWLDFQNLNSINHPRKINNYAIYYANTLKLARTILSAIGFTSDEIFTPREIKYIVERRRY